MRDESFVITFLSTTTRTTRTTAEIPRWCDEIENLTVVGESPNLRREELRHAPVVFGWILASRQMNALILQANEKLMNFILVAWGSLVIA